GFAERSGRYDAAERIHTAFGAGERGHGDLAVSRADRPLFGAGHRRAHAQPAQDGPRGLVSAPPGGASRVPEKGSSSPPARRADQAERGLENNQSPRYAGS